MRKNALLPISLLLTLAFLISSCLSTKSRHTYHEGVRLETQNTGSKKDLRRNIIREAKSLLGAKYKYGGKTPAAFDCSGYTSYIMRQNGIAIPSGSFNQALIGKKVSVKYSQPGDLIFFGNKGNVTHVGIVVENNKNGILVIHSTSSQGVVINKINMSKYWNERIMFSRNIID